MKRYALRQVVQLWYRQGARPEGARITAAGGQATGLAQVRDVVKLDLAPYPRIRRIFDECMKLPAFQRAHLASPAA